MGNKNVGQPAPEKITDDQMENSVQFIIRHQSVDFTKHELQQPLHCIMQHIRENDPLDHSSQYLKVNTSLIKLFFSPTFPRQLLKVLKLLIEGLEEINKKSLSFLKLPEVIYLTELTDFILFASNQKMTSLFDSFLVRSDIAPESKQTIKKLEEDNEGELEEIGNLIEKMTEEEKQGVQKILRVTIMSFITLRNQALSRSEQTLQQFSLLEHSLFMLYAKVFFSSYTPEFHTPIQKQSFKSNMIIGAYFLASGTSYFQPSVYEAAVIFLYSILKLPGLEHVQIKSLPSHYFKNLPVVPSSSLYEHILVYILFTLKYVQEGKSYMLRFFFNRINSLKMIQFMIGQQKNLNDMITFYLEELCLQVKVGQIERACLYEAVETYSKIGGFKSEVISKFLQKSNLKYNLKFADREIKVNPVQVLTELQDEKDTYSKQYLVCSEKYLHERIFMKALHFNLNDRTLWSQILPGIMTNKQDEQVQKMSEPEQQDENPSPEKEEVDMYEEEEGQLPQTDEQLK